jgi:hypothetical protein
VHTEVPVPPLDDGYARTSYPVIMASLTAAVHSTVTASPDPRVTLTPEGGVATVDDAGGPRRTDALSVTLMAPTTSRRRARMAAHYASENAASIHRLGGTTVTGVCS